MLFRILNQSSLSMGQKLTYILILAFCVLFSLSVHEFSHGLAAYAVGDKTAKYSGRLSLNPLAHLDPFGAICLFLFGFGWAKPVPIDPRNFKNPKVGMAITAIMGPIANIVAAFVGLLIYYPIILFTGAFPLSTIGDYIVQFLSFYISCNVGLAVFNLIPIPPLDGSKVLFVFLPDKAVEFFYRYQMYFFIGLFVLLYVGILNTPINWLSNQILDFISWLASLPYMPFVG